MTSTDSSELISNTTNKENFIYRRKRKDSAPDKIESTEDKVSFDDSKNYLKRSYDTENYYRHRMSRHSLKDYASLPYYQYSRRIVKRVDKALMTDESFLLNNIATTKIMISKPKEELPEKMITTIEIKNTNKIDCSTSTSDLIDDFSLGYFSKAQLMSSFSLLNTKSTLYNSFSNTEYEDKNESTKKTEYYYSYSKEYFVKSNDGQPPTHISGLTIQTNDVRQRPTRSNNWSLLNRSNSSGPNNRDSIEIALPLPASSSIQQQTSSYRFFPPYKYIRAQIPSNGPLPLPPAFKSAKF
jgi:hypothetical protein